MAGKLVIIGGAEDQNQHCTILKKVLELSEESKARVAVIATASAKPAQTGQDYEQIFYELGAESVRILQVLSRKSAQDPSSATALREASIIFITGGDQLRLTSILGGTALMETLWERFTGGAILAGTSAGASAMSATMIIGGEAGQPPQRELIHMSPGLGFLPGVLVDQHFAQRGRFGRLIAAVALNPGFLGIGIDEDTAIIVSENRWLETVGSYGISIIDGSGLFETNISETAPYETLTLSPLQVHILAHGAGFDLLRRRLIKSGKGEQGSWFTGKQAPPEV
ncbi:MAG: cyanophycinase [Dethiobacter sp.]|jgi:cyanophycinase|nr:cyanophycinase [Dethiobacter sp.]